MRRIFVGDIQGCSEPLRRLCRRLDLGTSDRLICLGDVVNRGPDSLGVLRCLSDMNAELVLGNHDLFLLKIMLGLVLPPPHSPLHPLLEATDCTQLVEWLGGHPVMIVEPDLVAVHAGLHPTWRDLQAVAAELNLAMADRIGCFADAGIEFATKVRYCDKRGRRPPRDDPPPGPPFKPWDTFYAGSRTVIFGHWARRGLVSRPQIRGLDSGCVYGGPLTAWIAEEDRLVQVDGQSSA